MAPSIVDVRTHERTEGADDLRASIIAGLGAAPGHRTLPTLLLYDEHGLRLYDDITTKAPEYYLFPAEEDILKLHASDIVSTIRGASKDKDGSETVVELGAG
jgi:L-histidine Nalpha-methyltransferase / hercynylcysteine S-oxide synthase